MNRSGVLLRLSLSFPGESDGRVVGDHVRSHPGHPYIERLYTDALIIYIAVKEEGTGQEISIIMLTYSQE